MPRKSPCESPEAKAIQTLEMAALNFPELAPAVRIAVECIRQQCYWHDRYVALASDVVKGKRRPA